MDSAEGTRHGGGRGGSVGAASAVKMAYASWTKGSAALLLAARALARAEGVEETLLAEWGISQPGLEERSARAAGSAAAKGWRWIAEMEEIAATMAAAGLPGGFHQAAAEIYRRFPRPTRPGMRLAWMRWCVTARTVRTKRSLIRTIRVLARVRFQQGPRRSDR